MKSNTIGFMQKSFLVSLVLSFVFAFATSAYLSSPSTLHIRESRAHADTVEEAPQQATSTDISFSALDLITITEEGSESTSTSEVADASQSHEKILPTQPVEAAPKPVSHPPRTQTSRPVTLVIPSIGLTAPIQSVGLNDKGEMAVPDGDSSAVGWYKYGTLPGNIGSAVLDAHVFAAFDKLRYLKVGSEVFIDMADGQRLTFVVNDSRVYQLGELTSGMLFSSGAGRRLNLITCAGQPTADGSTYTHRLVVYTKLVA